MSYIENLHLQNIDSAIELYSLLSAKIKRDKKRMSKEGYKALSRTLTEKKEYLNNKITDFCENYDSKKLMRLLKLKRRYYKNKIKIYEGKTNNLDFERDCLSTIKEAKKEAKSITAKKDRAL